MSLRGPAKKKECTTFEPQQWRKNVCRNCFRSKPEHTPGGSSGSSSNNGGASGTGTGASGASAKLGSPTASSKLDKKELRKPDSPQSRRPTLNRTGSVDGDSGTSKQKTPSPREGKKIGPTSPGGRGLRRSPPSPTTTSVTAKKSQEEGASKIQSMIFERSGPSARPPISSSCTSIDSRYVEELENDFFDLEDKYSCMEKEKDQMKKELDEERRNLAILVEQVTDYKNRIASLEKRCAHLEDEIKNYRERMKLPESEQGSFEEGSGGAATEGREELQQRVEEMEQLCQDLLEENEVLKEEVEEMQREIEEMHDHFQDEDTDTLRELQRELEASNKTSRIFQFKLRKAERRYEQCESERLTLEEKLHRLEHQFYSNDDRAQIRELEDELRMAKEVSVRLHDELEFLEEKRSRYESDNSRLKDELSVCDRQRVQLENEMGRLKLEMDKLRTESGISDRGPLQVTDRSSPRSRLSAKSSLSREPSLEEQSLSRELESSKERETDLLEQVRFAEEQVRNLKRKLQDVEEENESLTKKCQKLVASRGAALRYMANKGTGESRKSPEPSRKKSDKRQDDDSSSDSSSDSDDANSRLQMRFLEQEATVLRKRVIVLERENDQLQRNISLKAATGSWSSAPSSPSNKKGSMEAPAVLQTSPRPNPSIVVQSSDPPNKSEEDEATKALKVQTMRLDRELRKFTADFAAAEAKAEEKRRELIMKVSDLENATKERDLMVTDLQKRMTDLKRDNEALEAEKCRLEDRMKKERGRSKLDLKSATKEDLIDEVDNLDDELDDMYELVKKGDAKVVRLEEQISKFDKDIENIYSDFGKRERELLQHIEAVGQRQELTCNLLQFVTERADAVKEQLENLTKESGKDPAADDLLKARLVSLEKLLQEEKQRTKVAEKNLETAANVSPEGVDSRSAKDNKDIERLKRDLEEKEQLIDEKDDAMKDLRQRLDQSRRMYDAVKLLVDKGEDDIPKAKKSDSNQNIESASYKLELKDLKSKLSVLTAKLEEAEKANEKLRKEHLMLMEDVKVREDTIFEQDDEIERKNDEIRNLKFYIEEEKTEMARIREEMSSLQEQMQSVKQADGQLSQIEQEFDRMKLSLDQKDEEIVTLKHQLQEKELETGQAEEQSKILADSVRNRDDRIKEKDELIQHINCRLQNREREMADTDNMLKQTTEKLLTAESEIKTLRLKLGNSERDMKVIQSRVEDLKSVQERHLKEVSDLKDENKRLTEELDKNSRSKDKEISTLKEEVRNLKQTGPPTTSSESEKNIRSELEKVKKERDDYKASSSVEVRLQGRVKLLNEEVGRLNLAQVSLKIQNEALQRDAMEYRQSYYALKEQYQVEQDAWETEKCFLESKSKAKDEQKATVMSLRKSLQEATHKLSGLEQKISEQTQEYEKAQMVADREKMEIQAKLNQYEEQQKVPKVLQKFRGKTPAMEAAWEKERNEYKVRLNSHEKTVLKLRTQITDLEKKFSQERRDHTNSSEDRTSNLEKENDSMKQACVELEHLRQHCTALRDRVRHLEGLQDRERRIWQDERSQLQYRGEEGKVMIDHWLNRLKIAVNDVPKDSDLTVKDLRDVLETLKNILDEMDKFKRTRDRSPYVHIRRRSGASSGICVSEADLRWPDNSGSHDQMGGSTTDLPGSPITTSGLCSGAAGLVNPAVASLANQLPLSNRSVSLDWSHTGRLRSASPEPSTITVRKLTNFPDPTPGFLVRSRQTSTESLQDDYTQRSFTVPHNFQRASSVTPTVQTPKEKFLDDYDKKVRGSTDQLASRLKSAEDSKTSSTSSAGNVPKETSLPPTSTSTTSLVGAGTTQRKSIATPGQASNRFGMSVLERRKMFSNKSSSLDSKGKK